MKTIFFGKLILRSSLEGYVQEQIQKATRTLKKEHADEKRHLEELHDQEIHLLTVEKDVQIHALNDKIAGQKKVVREAETMRIGARIANTQVADMIRELSEYMEKFFVGMSYAQQDGLSLFGRLREETEAVRKSLNDRRKVSELLSKKELADAERKAQIAPEVRDESHESGVHHVRSGKG
jgi:dsDNA-binding SOS-regulon protein